MATSSSRSSHFIGISDPKLMIMFAAKELSSYKVPLFSGILWHTEEVSYKSNLRTKQKKYNMTIHDSSKMTMRDIPITEFFHDNSPNRIQGKKLGSLLFLQT